MMQQVRRAFVVACSTSALLACSKAQPKRASAAAPVRVSTVSRIDAPVTVAASGVVEPMQTVSVTTQVAGSLLDVLFHEGDYVTKGQVLFRIDPRTLQADVDQARSVLARDEAQAAAASKDDVRYRTLADMGYVSRSQADQYHAAAEAQAATVAADRAALRSAEVNLGYATIRAPISGRTGSLLQKQGNNVSPGGGPLVIINQISPVLVRFPVLSQDFAAMQQALALHPLHVSAVASDSTQSTDEGTLSFLDNAVDSLTGSVTGKATFQNPGRRLWPGELVFLTITLDVQHNVLAVPTSAIQTGQQGEFIYVVDAKKTAQRRPVVSGVAYGDLTVVRQGLAGGETIIVDGQSRVNPGGRVAMMTSGGDSARGRDIGGVSGGSLGGEVVPVGGAQGSGGGGSAGAGQGGGPNGPPDASGNSPNGGGANGGGAIGRGANGARGGANGAGSPNPTGQSTTGAPGFAPGAGMNGTSTPNAGRGGAGVNGTSGVRAPGANGTPAPTGARGSAGAVGSTGAQTPGTTTRPPTSGRPPYAP
jgi:membrane fusion protein, multidrug efflux system